MYSSRGYVSGLRSKGRDGYPERVTAIPGAAA